VRAGEHRRDRTLAPREGAPDETLQLAHLLGRQRHPDNVILPEDLLRLLQADTRHQDKPGITPKCRDHVPGTALEQIASVAKAEEEVPGSWKRRGYRPKGRLRISQRDTHFNVPGPPDHVHGQALVHRRR
jgi:hypothetical protein